MKRKDIISLIAMMIILIIAYLGTLFKANGNYIDALINMMILVLPLSFFFIFAVIARNKTGNFVKFWRASSYISFAVAIVFLLVISGNFMHYFNVIAKQDKVSEKVELIIKDYISMYDEYEKLVQSRVASYNSELMSMYNQNQYDAIKQMFHPTMTISKLALEKVADDWKEKMFKNYSGNKRIMSTSVTDYQIALIDNFKVFSAAKELNNLISQYNSHKAQLEEDFAQTTAIENSNNITPVFTFKNEEIAWRNVQDIFAKSGFNALFFVIYLVLATLACSTYIFFKDTTVKAPKRTVSNQDVYSLGHRL